MVHRLQEKEREEERKPKQMVLSKKKKKKTYQESLNNYMLSVKILPLSQGVKTLQYISKDNNFEKCLGSANHPQTKFLKMKIC